ncbi:MAG: hypothetical protein H6843_08735 [Rhodospirillaceae bacterium]|nr:hypothetical protein [Rhodospirillaceae bacterium]
MDSGGPLVLTGDTQEGKAVLETVAPGLSRDRGATPTCPLQAQSFSDAKRRAGMRRLVLLPLVGLALLCLGLGFYVSLHVHHWDWQEAWSQFPDLLPVVVGVFFILLGVISIVLANRYNTLDEGLGKPQVRVSADDGGVVIRDGDRTVLAAAWPELRITAVHPDRSNSHGRVALSPPRWEATLREIVLADAAGRTHALSRRQFANGRALFRLVLYRLMEHGALEVRLSGADILNIS